MTTLCNTKAKARFERGVAKQPDTFIMGFKCGVPPITAMDKKVSAKKHGPKNKLISPCNVSPSPELTRLIAAAVVDRQFCKLLLNDPAAAIESGYGRESFQLTAQEKALIISCKNVESLADLAGCIANFSSLPRVN